MGLNVSVYRWDLGDCTNGGISSTARELCLTNVEGPDQPSDRAPAAFLKRHTPFGEREGRIGAVVVPAELRDDGHWHPLDPAKDWTMFGGNYAASSDSRFRAAVSDMTGYGMHFAVPIHDRIER